MDAFPVGTMKSTMAEESTIIAHLFDRSILRKPTLK
jgi:hypothetical protein